MEKPPRKNLLSRLLGFSQQPDPEEILTQVQNAANILRNSCETADKRYVRMSYDTLQTRLKVQDLRPKEKARYISLALKGAGMVVNQRKNMVNDWTKIPDSARLTLRLIPYDESDNVRANESSEDRDGQVSQAHGEATDAHDRKGSDEAQSPDSPKLHVSSTFAGLQPIIHGSGYLKLEKHQVDAHRELDLAIKMDRNIPFAGLLVMPTGGGKTRTAMQWVLKNALDEGQKVIWIAHRHELLNQALRAAKENSGVMRKRQAFRYRVLSGQHDKPVHLRREDDLLIASKDSLSSGMHYALHVWLHPDDRVFMVIDEAHHATARTYRRIIDAFRLQVRGFRLLGLTATPFRTSPKEQSLLKKVFPDDIVSTCDLQTLISRGILAQPIFKECRTHIDMASDLTDEVIQQIRSFDLPEDMALQIAKHRERNHLIVSHFIDHQNEYGQTLIFAVNQQHAIELASLFRDRGIQAEFAISSVQTSFTRVPTGAVDNDAAIRKFRSGDIQVLVNVQILTEGTDLPNVQTVFLTRPTISSILVTQMIGRALRGPAFHGTEKAYIVSFIDNWSNKIAWENPKRLSKDEEGEFADTPSARNTRMLELISIDKIEEFATMMDRSTSATKLQNVSFSQRVPVGFFSFALELDEEIRSCEVLVYSNTQSSYERFVADLQFIAAEWDIVSGALENADLMQRISLSSRQVERDYFTGIDDTPGYHMADLQDILRYYSIEEQEPPFLVFESRPHLHLEVVARFIYDSALGGSARDEDVDRLWNDPQTFWKSFFGHEKRYFLDQLDLEIRRIGHPELFTPIAVPQATPDQVQLDQLSMEEIRIANPQHFRKLHDHVFSQARDAQGYYTCATTGYRSSVPGLFEIDHIVPRAKGGLTVPENLQLLSREANRRKGSKD